VYVDPPYLKVGAADPKWTKKFQRLMPEFGQDVGLVDGQYGARSKQACVNIQIFFGLLADGECGPKTWAVVLGVAP
jgi:peptidoglycan hydrolase-like protein with peptidoglycan-binding domain